MISSDAERKRSQRERTAKSRAKHRAQSANNLAENEKQQRAEFDLWRVIHRLVWPGEREPWLDLEQLSDALCLAREFLLALNQPDVEAGETLLDVERRVITAWCQAGAPLLNRNTIRLETSVASAESFAFNFDKSWVALPGSDALIDVSTLPVIEIPVVDTPVTVKAPITVEDSSSEVSPTHEEQLAVEHRHQTGLCRVSPQEALILKTQQDAMDEKARKLSAANEARELANERRLGDAYIPSSELHFRNSR